MLPKVASLPSLQGAVRSVAQRNSQASARDTSNGRRRSIDTPSRSRSRPGSSVDLVSLDVDVGSSSAALPIAIPRPPTTPAPALWPLVESPTSSFNSNDALARMEGLPGTLNASHGSKPSADLLTSWATLPSSPFGAKRPPPSPIAVPNAPCHLGVAPVSLGVAPAQPAAKAQSAIAAPASVPIDVPSVLTSSPSSPLELPDSPVECPPATTEGSASAVAKRTGKTKSKRVGPAARPGPDEVRIYRSTLPMDYVQELLGNLSHVQRMVRGVAEGPSSTAVAAATAAARLLSRSLSRAAARVRESVKDATTVYLSEDALVTLAEFGWVEVSTEDPDQARFMGCVEAEVHHLPSGRIASYQRPAADKAWWQVGEAFPAKTAVTVLRAPSPESPRSTLDGPVDAVSAVTATPHVPVPPGGVKMDVSGRSAAAIVAGRGGLTIAGLADHLLAASQSVLSAALHLQQWVDEHKTSLKILSTASTVATPSVPAATVVGFHPAVAI